MKSRRIKFMKKTAVWLMTVILVINYCVNIALAAEGIGKDELRENAVVAGEVTVHVPVNPDAVVDAAIFQANSGVMPMAGALPVGSVTVEGIPVTASVTFSVEAETFAEKCAALTVGDFDRAMVFDADYRSALRQDASTAAVWQEAAAMLDGVAILNGSDRLVNLVVEPVQTGDAVALAPEAASLVAGEPLDEEAAGGQESPDTEDGAKDEAAGEEEKTTDPEDEPAGEADGGDVSDGEIQEPDDREEPEKSDPEDQPDSSMEEDVPGEGPADAAADEEDAVIDETEDEPEEEPDTEPRDEPEEAGNDEPGTENEPEETGEGSVEANAGRQEHVIFYETAGNDAPFGEPDGEDVSGEPEQQDQKTEEPAGDTGDERQDDAAADDAGEDGRDAGDGADEGNQDAGDDPDGEEPAPLPEETIEQAEGSVTVMNARPMGGVLMSFRAAAPLSATDGITVTGQLTSGSGGAWNAEFYWCKKESGKYRKVSGNGTDPVLASGNTVFIPYPQLSNGTYFLIMVPADGYRAFDGPLGTLTVTKAGKKTFTGMAANNVNGVLTLPEQVSGESYKQYRVVSGGVVGGIVLEDAQGQQQNVYCYNEKLVQPLAEHNVRYILDPDFPTNPQVIRVMQFGNPGEAIYRTGGDFDFGQSTLGVQTQLAIWYFLDSQNAGVYGVSAQLVKLAEDESYQPDFGNADVSLSADEASAAGIRFAKGEPIRSNLITLSGNSDLRFLELPEGVRAYSADNQELPVVAGRVNLMGDQFYLVAENESVLSNVSLKIEAVKTRFTPVDSDVYFKRANNLLLPNEGEDYQDLVGYNASRETNTTELSLPLYAPDSVPLNLTLKKVAAENPGTPLKDAGFKLEKHENNRWVTVSGGEALTTNENGLATAANLSLDVPYKLTEITPPEGYDLLESPVLFMLADNGGSAAVYQVNEENGTYSRGGLWAADGQGITVSGLTMTVPNTARQEPEKTLKLHLDHLVQPGYNSSYDTLVSGAEFQFALVNGEGAVVARGSSHGQFSNVTWDNGSETVDLGEGVYYLFGYDVPQPFQRVIHEYQTAKNAGGNVFDPTFGGTAGATESELREAASRVSGTPYMGVKITVTDADMTMFNGGTLYYHAESNLPMGRLTVRKTYYNRTYRSAGDEFRFEIRKLDGRTDTFDQGEYYQTVTVRAGDGSQSIDLPYGIYAIRETGMPSRYSFNIFASGAGVAYNPSDNFARFSFPRSLLDSEPVNPVNEWQVTVTAENRVHNDSGNDDDDDDDDDSYRSDGTTEGGGGGSDPGRSLFNHDDLVNIPEEAVPLSDKPLVEIPDEDVPLGALPNTGGFSMGVFAVLGAAITAIGVFLRKGKQSKA